MIIRDTGANGIARNLRTLPFHGEAHGSIAEDAEVEAVVRVLPQIFGVNDQVFAERLLESRVKLVTPSGMQRHIQAGRSSRGRAENPVDHRVIAAGAGYN